MSYASQTWTKDLLSKTLKSAKDNNVFGTEPDLSSYATKEYVDDKDHHTHDNAEVLSKLTESEGKLLYNDGELCSKIKSEYHVPFSYSASGRSDNNSDYDIKHAFDGVYKNTTAGTWLDSPSSSNDYKSYVIFSYSKKFKLTKIKIKPVAVDTLPMNFTIYAKDDKGNYIDISGSLKLSMHSTIQEFTMNSNPITSREFKIQFDGALYKWMVGFTNIDEIEPYGYFVEDADTLNRFAEYNNKLFYNNTEMVTKEELTSYAYTSEDGKELSKTVKVNTRAINTKLTQLSTPPTTIDYENKPFQWIGEETGNLKFGHFYTYIPNNCSRVIEINEEMGITSKAGHTYNYTNNTGHDLDITAIILSVDTGLGYTTSTSGYIIKDSETILQAPSNHTGTYVNAEDNQFGLAGWISEPITFILKDGETIKIVNHEQNLVSATYIATTESEVITEVVLSTTNNTSGNNSDEREDNYSITDEITDIINATDYIPILTSDNIKKKIKVETLVDFIKNSITDGNEVRY